jgi:hypothetical protein
MAGRKAAETAAQLTAKSSTYRRESPRRFMGRLRKGLAEIERKR